MGTYQITKLLHSKENNRVKKQQTTEWEKIFDFCSSNSVLTFRIYKELKKLNTKNK
jgi:hypothetical protein